MKYLKYFEGRKIIDSICKMYGIENYTINSDGTVDVNGNVNLFTRGLTKLPLKFGYVSGGFRCGNNHLTSLEGAPKEVGGSFLCTNNRLTSLEGCPKKVGGSFDCGYNQLINLEGAPIRVDGYFDCCENRLTSLEGAPSEVVGDFFCSFNKLKSLLGSPEEIGGSFYCDDNPLPEEILDNMIYIKKIIKYQSDYNIWRRDGSLDKYRFSDMMKEILEEENNI